MSLGNISGMNLATLVTVATVVTVPGTAGGGYICARLAAGAANSFSIYNNTTAAGNRVARLQTAAAGADELRIAVRCQNTVKVQMTTTASSSIAFVYLA